MDSIGDWFKGRATQFTELSTSKKALCVVGFFVGIELLLYVNKKFNPEQDEDQHVIERDLITYSTQLAVETGEYSTIADENPDGQKSKQIIECFVGKLARDPELSRFFDKRELLQGSILVRTLQNQFVMSMGGPFIEEGAAVIIQNLREKHIKITKAHHERWLQLWRQALRQNECEDRHIWEVFPVDLFRQQVPDEVK